MISITENPASLVSICAACAVGIGALVSVFREDNTASSTVLSPRSRLVLSCVLGTIQAFVLAVVAGTPWWQAILGALASVGVAHAQGATRIVPAIALVIASSVVACSPSSRSAGRAAVSVAGVLCHELDAPDAGAPAWLDVACKVEGVAAPIVVHVALDVDAGGLP